jgi:putative membrane protein insertion efficiency factor
MNTDIDIGQEQEREQGQGPGSWPARLVVGLLILAIRLYQVTLGPLLAAFGTVCNYEPSCSRYMIGALRKYGLFKGLSKGFARVLRCHPWHPGGYDPP